MTGSNRFASLSHSRVCDARLSHDEYETPDNVTELLLAHHRFQGPILDPCAGSRRVLKVCTKIGLICRGMDIRDDPPYDFLEEDRPWSGSIITNPPYHNGMADAFVAKALRLCRGGDVAMLLQVGMLFGSKRTEELWRNAPPAKIIPVPWRIRFHVGGTDELIRSQAYNHIWVIWHTPRRPYDRTDWVIPALDA